MLVDHGLCNFCIQHQASANLQDCLCNYHELINAPKVGCAENFLWPLWQLNVALAAKAAEGRFLHLNTPFTPYPNTLAEDFLANIMGEFGKAHTDDNNSASSYSGMIVLSDLPVKDGWEPGRFHILALGVYVTFTPFLLIYFPGCLHHGGMALVQPPNDDEPLSEWAYRLVMIGYPLHQIVKGNVCHALAALPGRAQPLYLSLTGDDGCQVRPLNED